MFTSSCFVYVVFPTCHKGCTAHHSQVNFCTYTLKMQVADPTSEWQLKLAALMKTCALGQGSLQSMQHEEWIFGKDIKAVKARVPDEHLKDFSAARKLVGDMVKGDHVESFADILTIIKANQSSLLAADRSFILEIQLLRYAPAALEETVKKRLLAILPSETKDISLKQVLYEIQALKLTELVSKSSNGSKGQVAAFEEIVANMLRGIGPDPGPAKTCSFYGLVMLALQWFCRAYTGKEGDEKGLIRGESALNYLYEKMDTQIIKDSAPSLGELEVIMGPCTRIAFVFVSTWFAM